MVMSMLAFNFAPVRGLRPGYMFWSRPAKPFTRESKGDGYLFFQLPSFQWFFLHFFSWIVFSQLQKEGLLLPFERYLVALFGEDGLLRGKHWSSLVPP